jgi:hypothetical protein
MIQPGASRNDSWPDNPSLKLEMVLTAILRLEVGQTLPYSFTVSVAINECKGYDSHVQSIRRPQCAAQFATLPQNATFAIDSES